MPFYPVTQGAQVRFIQNFRDQLVVNSLWFYHPAGAPTAADILALATGANFNWQSSIATLLSNDVSYERVIVRDYSAPDSFEAVESPSAPVPGTAGDAMPNNVALAVGLRTLFSGRAYRGRIFLAGIPRSVVVENSVDSAFLEDVDIALEGFIGLDQIAPGWVLGVAHRVSAGLPLNPGTITEAVSWSVSDAIVDSQRRRLPGRGK